MSGLDDAFGDRGVGQLELDPRKAFGRMAVHRENSFSDRGPASRVEELEAALAERKDQLA
jgi:hypothetical protein